MKGSRLLQILLVLLATCLLAFVAELNVFQVSAVSYLGVKIGDAWSYGNFRNCYCTQCLGSFPVGNLSAITSMVMAVSGSNLTLLNTVTFTNGTKVNLALVGNVDAGTGNLTQQRPFPVLSGGLVAGDRVFNSLSAPTINATVTGYFAGGGTRGQRAPHNQQLSQSRLS